VILFQLEDEQISLVPLLPLLFLALVLVIRLLAKLSNHVFTTSQIKLSNLVAVASILFTIIWFSSISYNRYRLWSKVKNNEFHIVEGEISDFQEMGEGGQGIESFIVDSVRFTYMHVSSYGEFVNSDRVLTSGKTQERIVVHYAKVDRKNLIVKIETIQNNGNE